MTFLWLLLAGMMEPGGWADTYEKEWETLTNCVAMAAEEERIKQVRVAKLERDLETLKLEASHLSCSHSAL